MPSKFPGEKFRAELIGALSVYALAPEFTPGGKRLAHIKTVHPRDATGVLKEVYDAATKRAHGIAQIIQVMSRDGHSTRASMDFYVAVMKRQNALSAARREMLATVVSNINDCYY